MRRRTEARGAGRSGRIAISSPWLLGLALLGLAVAFWLWPSAHPSNRSSNRSSDRSGNRSNARPPVQHGAEKTVDAGGDQSVERLKIRVLHRFPHARDAYTQGLLWHDGKLYESTGQYGQSSLRRVDLTTGTVERQWDLAGDLFAEGLARVGDRLIQLTWHAGLATVYSRQDFSLLDQYSYPGEGWGLCHDGARLVMSDGSDRLSFRDPDTFATLGEVRVTLGERSLSRLNELECVDGAVWANVWTTDLIVRIDPESGRVTATVDASALLRPEERPGVDVLNGIAYRPEAGTFLVTGKYWPTLFEVEFVASAPH